MSSLEAHGSSRGSKSRIYLDHDGDPRIVPADGQPEDGWTILTDDEPESMDAAWALIHDRHPELIVNHRALRWWDTRLCWADRPTNPNLKLSEYRREAGGIENLCEAADACQLLNDRRACHGVVWCPIYNLGWTNSHNCTEGGFGRRFDLSPQERRTRELDMMAEADRARRYQEKGLSSVSNEQEEKTK